MKSVIALVTAIAAGPMVILAWSLAYPAQCWVLVLPAIIALVLTLAARELARRRRACIADFKLLLTVAS